MHRLFLLDGMALVYRAHFAFIRNPITNSKGLNTSAAFGFTNTLLNLLDAEKPTHLGVAFDTSAPTTRHKIFPDYKAQRDAMPEELAANIPLVKDLCTALQIPLIIQDGFEADDLIGTMAKEADAAGGIETYMVTPDKDFAQLVSPTTFMWKPGRQGADNEILDVAAVCEQWQIERPEQVIDILALWGDASDNIPGVPGIGEKTAKKLIAQYGSVEALLENTADLKGKQKENVEANKDNALLCKTLTTIITDCPNTPSIDDLKLTFPQGDDAKPILDLFNELEFRTLTRRISSHLGIKGSPAPAPAASQDTSEKAAESPQHARQNLGEGGGKLLTIEDTKPKYQLHDTEAKQLKLLQKLHKKPAYCFDIETTSLNRFTAQLLGIAFSYKKGEAHYLPVDLENISAEVLDSLKKLLANTSLKIGHNLKYDIGVLSNLDIPVAGPHFDTFLTHALLEPDQRHTMDLLAENLLGYQTIKLSELVDKHEQLRDEAEEAAAQDDLFAAAEKKTKKKRKKDDPLDLTVIPLDELAQYAAEDADITYQLYELLEPRLKESGQLPIAQDIEFPLLPTLIQIESQGITLDTEALSTIGTDLEKTLYHLTADIHREAGQEFNLNSPKQLGEILFGEMKLVEKPKKTKTGQFKTDEQTLQSLAHEHDIVANILTYREASKLKSTYIDALPHHIEPHSGRIHTHFHQLVAATGRLASTEPNLQNIPIRSDLGKKIRAAFVPKEGHAAEGTQGTPFKLLAADYSQIELRIMAALSEDQGMIEAFTNDEDIHTATAAKVYGIDPADVTRDHRSTAKMVNFGIIYGISPFGLSQRLHIPRGEAAEIIDNYFAQYPGVKNYMESTVEKAKENGYVETLSGRRRNLRDINSSNKMVVTNAERAAINAPIQGTAADMIKIAMIKVQNLLNEGPKKDGHPYQTTMILQVHDELLFDLHPDEETDLTPKIIKAMETALPLPNNIPAKVETGTGQTWLEAH